MDDGTAYQIQAKDGDIIILATDGVYDNLFEHEILAIVKHETSSSKSNLPVKSATEKKSSGFSSMVGLKKKKAMAERLAANITSLAEIKSKQKLDSTPFEIKIHEYNT